MKLVHYFLPARGQLWGLLRGSPLDPAATVHPIAADEDCGGAFLATLLQLPGPARILQGIREEVFGRAGTSFAELAGAPSDPARPHLLAPLDRQEVWAAGVTYLRSKVARMEESEGAARFYDLVYDAERPELFFKGAASRVSGPGAPIRIRSDAAWNVPEPEAALLLSPRGQVVGYTLGNDVSSRDIEGENPLYLPQAKVYRQACALGPVVWLVDGEQVHQELEIHLEIRRGGAVGFSGATSTTQMKRTFGELATWLLRDNTFPGGVYLLTGTGLVPGDDFTLHPGDEVTISSPNLGALSNPVEQGGEATSR